MPNFLEYNPEQAYLLPPSVRDVLGEGHLCFFVHGAVERLDLGEFEAAYSEEGHPAYHPALLLKVWLYAYALGVTSSRRLEQRIREDLAFRYLAGGAQPDFWALNEFRRRHRRAINEVFTQVVELARSLGMGKLGHVAIDSTRIAANAAADSADTLEKLRAERAKIRKQIRRWQQQCESADPNEGAGSEVAGEALRKLEQRQEQIPVRLERLKKAGVRRLSRTDADSRFLRDRRGFTLGYTATLAVSEDHLIVAQHISQEATDNHNLARWLNRGGRLHYCARHPEHQRMRRKLRSPAGRATYQRRKELAEPVMGVLKEQRGMRRFRTRGLAKVAVELALATTALNLTRLWRVAPLLRQAA